MLPPVLKAFLIFFCVIYGTFSIRIIQLHSSRLRKLIIESNKLESMQEMAVVIQFKQYNRFWSVTTQKIHISVRKGGLSLELIRNTR